MHDGIVFLFFWNKLTDDLPLSLLSPHSHSLIRFLLSLVISADYTVSSTTGASAELISSSVTSFTKSGAFTATLATSFPNATVSTLGSPVGTYMQLLLNSVSQWIEDVECGTKVSFLVPCI